MELTQEQAQAVLRAVDWYGQRDRAPVFRLFGPAGTGKTTLARIIADRIAPDGGVLYAAYTGKAAHVLRTKGANASTIHSLVYSPVSGSNPVRFELNQDSKLRRAGLLVLDEVSMVGRAIAEDLMSFGRPMLVLGDPAQLPPVGDDTGYFTEPRPDVLLEEVHRFALESPITRLATDIRHWPSGREPVPLLTVKGGSGRLIGKVPIDRALQFDQLIAGSNNLRWSYIRRMRRELGRPEGVPVKGDRIVILRNDRGWGIYNGQQFVVVDAAEDPRGTDRYAIEVRDDDGAQRVLLGVFGCGFRDNAGEKEAEAGAWRKGGIAATFANVITCHKSQGSEWSRVLVQDERRVFGRHGDDFLRSWMYTAITRAQDQVIVGGVK